MNLETGLWQQQTLKLQMTQQLSQAITLLQYSAQELSDFLEEKALENPFMRLERDHMHTVTTLGSTRSVKNGHNFGQENWIEQIEDGEKDSFIHYLYSQINLQQLPDKTKHVFAQLLHHLDENGYIRVTSEELACQLSVSKQLVEEGIELLQRLEPVGVGARNLQECLLLQLKGEDATHQLAKEIVACHFHIFAEKKWTVLAQQLQVGLNEIQAVSDLLQTLNPKPGAPFINEDSVYLIPDVVVDLDGNDFIVKVAEDHLPAISFRHEYHERLANYKDRRLNKFLQEKSAEYHWILRSIQQRNDTLVQVMLQIIHKQQSFFRKSTGQLSPLTMKEISEALDIHISTVSRAVREKYVQTPFGIYELKSFFTSTLQTTSTEKTSSAQVKKEITEIIDGENKYKPLSDQKIATLLKERKGIVISRRTVAKYRKELGIGSSTKRKRFK